MCSICGIASTEAFAPEHVPMVRSMVELQRHRGPDMQQTRHFAGCVLGHARLAVLDLSTNASQPMSSADGRYHIVFNGEIYNFKTLRGRLGSHTWHSTSDTEVLLELFVKEGTDCLKRLNGMFAFAVWDSKERRLFLVRDRFGQKPLFFARVGSQLIFSSEVLPLFQHPGLQRRPNLNALYHFLSVQSVPPPLSSFEGVDKLMPGHWLEWHEGVAHISRYWSPEHLPVFNGSEQEAEEELKTRLMAAVDRHLLSDVAVGTFLSGGVDSSLITALACRRNNKIQSFCIGFEDIDYDERPFAAQAAAECGSRHRNGQAAPDLAAMLPCMTRHYGEPFADSSALPTWLLCTMARQHVKVVLSGDGGDDFFGGYERHLNPFLFATPPFTSEVVALHKKYVKLITDKKYIHNIKNQLTHAAAKYYYHWARFEDEQKERLCTPLLRSAASPPLTLQLMLESFNRSAKKHLLEKIQHFELQYYLASTLMPKVDTAGMSVSLEVRSPFLDTELADFALSLPISMRVHKLENCTRGSFHLGWETKWLLKNVASQFVPPSLIYRRKMGFGVPLGRWLRNELRPMLEDELLESSSPLNLWVHPHEVRKLVIEHLSGKANHQFRLWTLLMLALWVRYCLKP